MKGKRERNKMAVELKFATICATVTTGLESVAVTECQEKLGCKTVRKERGRIYFDVGAALAANSAKLRSVEHLFVVVKEYQEFDFGDEESALERIGNLPKDLEWDLALSVWANYSGFKGCLQLESHKEGKDGDGDARCCKKLKGEPDEILADAERKESSGELPSFRVTCNRTGTGHSFSSMQAASTFGGQINKSFGWRVNLTTWDIEVLLNIVDKRVVVGIALTRETLGKRNLSHFGPTTLKSTLAYCMLKLADIKLGDVVCDPMCGGGSIPIESTLCWPSSVHLCGDQHDLAPPRTLANVQTVNKQQYKGKRSLPLDIFQWDVRRLPLKSNSVDVIISDLPFGKKSGSKHENWNLYRAALKEMARVCPPEQGRAVLLTQDKRVMAQMLKESDLWKRNWILWINMGGLQSGIYVLVRTARSVIP